MSSWLMLVGAGIGVLYAMGLWVSRFRLQMEGYGRLMRAAAVAAETGTEGADTGGRCC